MSIENTFERIANALEAIANQMGYANGATAQPIETPAAPTPQPAEAAAPAPEPAPSNPAATAAPAPTATTPTAASETVTMESLNQLCGAKAEKLGDAGAIFGIFQEFGAGSIPELKPEDYAAVKARVESL